MVKRSEIAALLDIMARLRDPERGCPWDRQQDFASIAPYTLEEAYEVADAIERQDPDSLRDELGDLLFQVVFHARMAEERGWFDFAAVASGIGDKLVRRHPHIFGDEPMRDAAEQSVQWENLKAQERAAQARDPRADVSALADVPRALPALTRAAKLGRRAARLGFDWANAGQVREKVSEELAELDGELKRAVPAQAQSAAITEELGDLLFALVNFARHLHIDAEAALRDANRKFERRFREMERLAAGSGVSLSRLSANEWDALWEDAKRRTARAPTDPNS